MPYTEAQKRASMKYMQEKTDDIRLRVIKGTKDRWKHYAALKNESMTVYVFDAVEARIAYDEQGEHELDPLILPNLIDWLTEHGHTPEETADCLQSLSNTGD